MADNDRDGIGSKAIGCPEHTLDERPAPHLVQNLRQGGFHSGSLPSREDDDVCVSH